MQSELPPSHFHSLDSRGGASWIPNLSKPRGPFLHIIAIQIEDLKAITVLDEFKQKQQQNHWQKEANQGLNSGFSHLIQPAFVFCGKRAENTLSSCENVEHTRGDQRWGEGKGREGLFIGLELISITPISVLPALLPLSVTQSLETDWLSVQRRPTCPKNKLTHCQFLLSLYLSICQLSRLV